MSMPSPVGSRPSLATLALAALLLVPVAGVVPAHAARGRGACTKACAEGLRTCLKAARTERTTLRTSCKVGSGSRRTCRKSARLTARAVTGACRGLRRQCRACCRARGPSCDQPAVVLDGGRAATGLVTAGGGTVTATGADGTTYTLDVPAGALDDDEAVTLTPLTSVGGFAVGEAIVAGVDAAPSGLLFAKHATLTIELPRAPAGRLVGFSYDGSGTDFDQTLVVTDGRLARIQVGHFSGFGAGGEHSPELTALLSRSPSAASLAFANQFLALGQRGVTDPEPYADVLRRWYRTVVRPGLAGAVGSDPRLRRALGDYDHWLLIVQQGPLALGLGFDLAGPLAPEQAEALGLIAAALRDAVARADARCLAQHSLAEAETALGWQVIAAAADVDTPANALDLDTVLDGLCVEAQYDDVSFPGPPPLGLPAVLRVRVGLAFIDGVAASGDRMEVRVTPHGTQEGPPIGDTDGSGTIEFSFTPLGDRDLRLDVHSCADVPGRRRLKRVCQDAFVVRGLDVEPPSVTLAPGGTQQFQATRFGQPAAVTWSTTTGTIDQSGNLTAGTAPGRFEVRARNPVDGRSTAAAVTITSTTTTTMPATVLGEWQGIVEVTNNGVPNAGVSCTNSSGCARMTVQQSGAGLRLAFCNSKETFCSSSAVTQQCSLLFDASTTGGGFMGTSVDNNAPCCIGCVGQNRVYGCVLAATFTVDPSGQQTLDGTFGGSVTSCPAPGTGTLATHFTFCRPNPCPVTP
jgi:hypothetical protein